MKNFPDPDEALMQNTEGSLLQIENLCLHFRTSKGIVRAVDGVNFTLGYQEAVVILGESGCGKTSLSKAILRLLPVTWPPTLAKSISKVKT